MTKIDEAGLDAAAKVLWEQLKVAARVSYAEAKEQWPGPDMLPAMMHKDAALAIEAYLSATQEPLSQAVANVLPSELDWINEPDKLAVPTLRARPFQAANGEKSVPLYRASPPSRSSIRVEAGIILYDWFYILPNKYGAPQRHWAWTPENVKRLEAQGIKVTPVYPANPKEKA